MHFPVPFTLHMLVPVAKQKLCWPHGCQHTVFDFALCILTPPPPEQTHAS